MLFTQADLRKLEAKETLEDKMPSETMRLAPRPAFASASWRDFDEPLKPEPMNPGSPLHGDPHDVPARKLPIMQFFAVDILKAQVALRDQQIANLSKWYNDSQATIEELKAVVANLKAEVVYLSADTIRPEKPKPSTGEALANALRADSFSSPYGR